MGKTRRQKKMRGGGLIIFDVTWSGEGMKDLRSLPKETEDDVPLSEIHSIADLVDEIETHVEKAGYTYVKVPLKSNRGGEPVTLRYISATWKGEGAPPTLPPFSPIVVAPGGKKLDVTANFTVRPEKPGDLLPIALSGMGKKSRGKKSRRA